MNADEKPYLIRMNPQPPENIDTSRLPSGSLKQAIHHAKTQHCTYVHRFDPISGSWYERTHVRSDAEEELWAHIQLRYIQKRFEQHDLKSVWSLLQHLAPAIAAYSLPNIQHALVHENRHVQLQAMQKLATTHFEYILHPNRRQATPTAGLVVEDRSLTFHLPAIITGESSIEITYNPAYVKRPYILTLSDRTKTYTPVFHAFLRSAFGQGFGDITIQYDAKGADGAFDLLHREYPDAMLHHV